MEIEREEPCPSRCDGRRGNDANPADVRSRRDCRRRGYRPRRQRCPHLLYQTTPAAWRLAPFAKAILIFPSIVKAGFIGGAQYGNEAPRKGGKTTGYYNMTAASYGLQAGVQSFS